MRVRARSAARTALRQATSRSPGQADFVAYHRDDFGERVRVAGVAGEDPDRGRAASRVDEQPVLALQLPALAVAGVAAAASGQCEPASHERDRSNNAIRSGFRSGARWQRARSASITSCLLASQSIAA